MRQKFAKLIVIFGLCILLINCLGYIFEIPELVTIMNSPTGGGQSMSNIPTILSLLITCLILLVIRINNNK